MSPTTCPQCLVPESARKRKGWYLSDLLLQRRGCRAVLAALSLALAVAALSAGGCGGGSCRAGGSGRVGDVGPAGVTQLLLLVAGLVLMFVVEHSFKVHHCPRVPGLGGAEWEQITGCDQQQQRVIKG